MQWFRFSLLVLPMLLCCGKPNQTRQQVKAAPIPRPVVVVEDSLIAYNQMVQWFSCNSRLDSLSYVYMDSFKLENPTRRIQFQRDFIEAQDRICKEQGLKGGYAEYQKLLAITNTPAMKHIIDSLKANRF